MSIGVCSANSGPYTTRHMLGFLAEAAEAARVESIWVSEHVVVMDPRQPPSPMEPEDPILDPVTALAFLAGLTSMVRLGTGVVVRGPAVEFHQVAFRSAPIEPGVAEMVPEPVRVRPDPALAAATDDHLVNALGRHRPPVIDAQPQLWPPGLSVPRSHPDIPVQGPGAWIADLDDALLAVLATDDDLSLSQVQVATLRIHRVVSDRGELGQPDAGRLEHRDDRCVAALGERPALAGALQFG